MQRDGFLWLLSPRFFSNTPLMQHSKTGVKITGCPKSSLAHLLVYLPARLWLHRAGEVSGKPWSSPLQGGGGGGGEAGGQRGCPQTPSVLPGQEGGQAACRWVRAIKVACLPAPPLWSGMLQEGKGSFLISRRLSIPDWASF